MLYAKKMLILSGEGKGVVLVEKSAHGIRLSLSTFDMPVCGELKAGVITRSGVFVRELPQRDNPSAVLALDGFDVDNMHFAVFDTKLRLYGTNGKRMWEANVMDLVAAAERGCDDDKPELKPLSPITNPPQTLPMPDGTGVPQSRLELYGDEALAASDFYTALDLSSRLPIVEKFLDTPRLLDGLAPVIVPQADVRVETTAVADISPVVHENQSKRSLDVDIDDYKTERTANVETTDSAVFVPTLASAGDGQASESNVMQSPLVDGAKSETRLPWQHEAVWLKSRATREKLQIIANIKPITQSGRVKSLRTPTFIERAKDDIERLFAGAERDKKLSALLPDVEWIAVETDGQTIYVGRGADAFLCYAIAGEYENNSPFGECSQWLPADKAIPTGAGYWLIFQSLKDGEIMGC